jgi:hypothetical protein
VSTVNSSADESDEQGSIEVVSVETDEVQGTIGPRRISGLVTNTTELSNEARIARVYGKKSGPRGQ